MDIKKIFLIMILGIFLISFVSAFEFDNIKPYDQVAKEYTIKNAFGLGEDLAKYKLISNTDNCLINCEATGISQLYSSGALFQNLRFKDTRDDWTSIKSFKIEYIVVEEIIINEPILSEDCSIDKFDNLICETIGYKEVKEYKDVWTEYNGEVLQAGTYTWRITGEKNSKERVDWIGSAFGEDFDAWAWWGGSWEKRKELNVTNAGGTLNNFTMLINIPYDSDMQIDFKDVRFVDGACSGSQTDELDYEFDKVVNSTTALGWVKIPALTTGDNEICMYYGNAVAGNGQDPCNAWDDNYVGVWHFTEGTGTRAFDSSCNGGNGTINGAVGWNTSTTIGNGATFTGADGTYFSLDSSVSVALANVPMSMESVVTFTGGSRPTFFSLMTATTGGYYFEVESGNQKFGVYGGSETNIWGSTNTEVTIGAFTYAGSTAIETWKNRVNTVSTTLADGLDSGMAYGIGGSAISGRYMLGVIDDIRVSDVARSEDWVDRNYDAITNYDLISFGAEENNGRTITATQSYPANASFLSTATVGIGCNFSTGTDLNVTSVQVLVYDSADNLDYDNTDATMSEGTHSVNKTWTTSALTDDDYFWACYGVGGSLNATTGNRTFSLDATAPTIVISSGNGTINYAEFINNHTINYTVTDGNLNNCWLDYNGANTSIGCDTGVINTTNFEMSSGIYNAILYGNDTLGQVASNEISWEYYVLNLNQSYASPLTEGSTDNIGIYFYNNKELSSGYLIYNGTSAEVTYNSLLNNYSNLSNIVSMPSVNGDTNISFYWNLRFSDGHQVNTTSKLQLVQDLNVGNCSVFDTMILNLSLKDEELNSYINATADSNIEVEIDFYPTDRSFLISTFHQQWEDTNNLSICTNLTSESYLIDVVIGFSAEDHVQEFFYIDNATLTTNLTLDPLTTKNINLMDLLTTDSTSFLFNYFDDDGLKIDDVLVHTFRKYIGEGIFREVERSKQNPDGNTVIHLVEEDAIYYFIVSKFGRTLFTSETYTALCQSTPCLIQLEESGGFQEFSDDWDLIDNGGYLVTTSSISREVTMNYSLTTPSTMNLTVYRLDSAGEYVALGSSSSTSTTGSLTVTVPTVSGNTSFFATIEQDGEFKKSQWVDFDEDAGLYFGNTLSLFLGALIILSLGLMAVAEGSATILFLILGMFVSMVLGVVDYRTSAGLSVLIYFIIAGALIMWKLTRRNR